MRARVVVIGVGVVLGVMLALAWTRLRGEARAMAAERESFARSDRALEQEQAALARRVVEMQLDVAERKRVVLATQSASNRARANVGAYVARLKAEHAGRAPIVRPPPPPTRTGGGAFFPELMSDPEYNALYARSTRIWLDTSRGGVLRGLGVPEEIVAKAVELLAEEETSLVDLQSLNAGKDYTKLRTQLQSDTAAQLQALLGGEIYNHFVDETDGSGLRRRVATEMLERRLSYAEEPLTDDQKARIQVYEGAQDYSSREFFQKQLAVFQEARKSGVIPVDEAKAAFYRTVLTPRQQEAVAELHAEAEAGLKRSLLPKYQEKRSAGGK